MASGCILCACLWDAVGMDCAPLPNTTGNLLRLTNCSSFVIWDTLQTVQDFRGNVPGTPFASAHAPLPERRTLKLHISGYATSASAATGRWSTDFWSSIRRRTSGWCGILTPAFSAWRSASQRRFSREEEWRGERPQRPTGIRSCPSHYKMQGSVLVGLNWDLGSSSGAVTCDMRNSSESAAK